jgi:hypothetical protein
MPPYPIPAIHTNEDGFLQILELLRYSGTNLDNPLEVNIDDWFDANMCASLGAIFTYLSHNNRSLRISVNRNETREILQKNLFLTHAANLPPLQDTYGSTIEYRCFGNDTSSGEAFKRYVTESFRPGVRGLPTMSELLIRCFRQSVFELYLNTVDHSCSTLGTFACGQYFHKKSRLIFNIADLGCGIPGSVRHYFREDRSTIDALLWATSGNTTRRGKRPGGSGLQLIREFISKNNGRLIIVSEDGFWIQKGADDPECKTIPTGFPGTSVTIEINTSDTASYCLSSEVDANDIF